MLLLARNFDLTRDRESTYLTSPVAVAATSINIKAVDSNAWADNDWLIIGHIGAGNAEILQVNGAVSDGTSLTIDNAGSGGARFAHSVNEPVYRIDYNQVQFLRNSTDTTTGASSLATNEIQPDNEFTRYEDTTNTTGFGFVRFYNSTTTSYSSYSDGIPYSGYSPRSLGRMQRKVRKNLGEKSVSFVDDEDINDELNEGQRDIAHERSWPFYEDTFSASTVAYQQRYDIDDDVAYGKLRTVVVRGEPMGKIDPATFDILQWDAARTGEPTHHHVENNQLVFWPNPSDAAQTTTLNGALSATATSITVVSTSGFSPSGRIIIDSEVISYTNTSTTAFRGCVRGLEETTAATHTSTTTVTERDIIYTANREPNELLDSNDLTQVPDPSILEDRASAVLAIGKMGDQVLHDRFFAKFEKGLEKLRDKFGRKGGFTFGRIKDKDEAVLSSSRLVDPNNFPTGITGS